MKLDDVIAAACEELDCSYEANAIWFEVLANQAINEMKTSRKLVNKQLEVDVVSSKFTLPTDFVKFVSLANCGLLKQGVTTPYCEDIDFVIQGSTLIFRRPVADGTKFVLEYRGLYTDENGDYIIPTSWERMLVAYIGWKYSRRYLNTLGPTKMQNYQREFQTQKLSNI
jgi:hypothetical protein